jgi:hypothetical protein
MLHSIDWASQCACVSNISQFFLKWDAVERKAAVFWAI